MWPHTVSVHRNILLHVAAIYNLLRSSLPAVAWTLFSQSLTRYPALPAINRADAPRHVSYALIAQSSANIHRLFFITRTSISDMSAFFILNCITTPLHWHLCFVWCCTSLICFLFLLKCYNHFIAICHWHCLTIFFISFLQPRYDFIIFNFYARKTTLH
jgi:hypothetical protein